MNSDTTEKMVALCRREGLDAIIATSPENFAYIAGFVVPSQPILRWRHSMLVIQPDSAVTAFTVDMEETTVANRLPGIPLRAWGEFTDNSMTVLANLLNDLSLARGVIAIETDYLPARDLDILKREMPEATFVAAESLFTEARMVKTMRELELLKRLSRISDESISDALAAVDTGSSDMTIASELTRGIYSRGAEDFKLLIVATGDRSQLPNVGPSGRMLDRGDICRVEIFSVLNGYHAGVCRSAYVESPPEHAEHIWSILADATQQLLQIIGPGASSREIYESYLKMIEPLQMPPIDFVGHGIGLHLHEEPYLSGGRDTELLSGMVMGIEPLIYRTGHGFGLQNKDMIAVTENGCRLLSDAVDTNSLIRCGSPAQTA